MPLRKVYNSLAVKLGIGIVPFVIVVFVVSLGFLFKWSREMVRQEAIEHAYYVLDNTSMRVNGGLMPDEHLNCIVLNTEGRYLLHTDTVTMGQETIFDDLDPLTQADVIALGHEMIAGKNGYMNVVVDGEDCLVFYKPLEKTSCSIALICKESDIFHSYNNLLYILVPLLSIGLLLLMFFLRGIVNFFINPVNRLASQTRHIADGNFDVSMPTSTRVDAVGRLQNNFAAMQQSLSNYISNLEQVNKETEQRNVELANANQQAEEAAQRQIFFLQNILHQIRTPLNIIMGFVQVLRDDYESVSREEMATITETMVHNSTTIMRMVHMLTAASVLDVGKVVDCEDRVSCNGVAYEAVNIYNECQSKGVPLRVETSVPDDMYINIHKDYFLKALNELLYNAVKYGVVEGKESEAVITLRVQKCDDFVQFIVEDNGPGVPPAHRSLIFNQFIKANSFSEGLGLGLFISKQFAMMMGGDLTLDESYMSGARFVLSMPA